MRNKIVAIGLTIIIMLVLISGGYWWWSHRSASTGGQSEAQNADAPWTLTKISDDAVISPFANTDSSAVWYFNSKGQLYRRMTDGSKLDEYTLPSLISNFKKAYWPATGSNLILAATSATGEQKTFFDSAAGTYKPLPANIKAVDWMPDGKRIVYVWQSGNGKSQQLMLANSDATNFTPIADVFWPDLQVKAAPNGQNVLLWRSPAQEVNKIYEANLATGQFTTLVDFGKNLEAMWAGPNKIIYVTNQNGKYHTMAYDIASKQATDLNINATLDKMAIDADGKYLYADTKDSATDVMWRLDLSSMKAQQLYTFDATISPRGLFVNGGTLFFVNSQDGKLYTLNQ